MADDLNITGEDFNINNSAPVEADVNLNVNNTFADTLTSEDQNSIINGVTFDEPYPAMPGYDVQTFESAIDFATEGMPNLEINDPFRNMIDAAAVDLDKYSFSIPPNNNLNQLYPGRAGSSFDPFRQTSGIPDLDTTNGKKAFLSQALNETIATTPDKTVKGYKAPFFYGAKRFELDRYYNHPRFSDLGFHPFANNEEYYQTNSSKWDNFTRTRAQWAAMFGAAFTSGWRSIGDMVSGDPFSSDMVGAQAMDDAMRIGRSGSGGVRGFANDLFLNSSYTVGIISSIALEELALFSAAAVQGGANPVADAALIGRTGMNIGKVGKAIASLFKMKTYTSAGANMAFRLNQINTAKRFWAASRSSARALGDNLGTFFTPDLLYQMKRVKAAAKAGDNMTQMAKGAAQFGGFYRDIRAINGAWSEAKMESGLVEMEEMNKHYMQIKEMKDGVAPTKEELDMVSGLAKGAGLTTQLVNLPLIYLSNKLVLDGAMRGFRPLGRVLDKSLSGTMGRIIRNPKNISKPFSDLGAGNAIVESLGLDVFRKMYKAGVGGSFKHLGATGLKYMTANLAEGFQELGQEATATGVKAYYQGLYEQDLATATDLQLAEMTDAYNSGEQAYLGDFKKTGEMKTSVSIMDAVGKGISSQVSGQGLHTFMSGFLMGGLIQGPQKVVFEGMPSVLISAQDKIKGTTKIEAYKKEKEEYITKTVETLNKVYQDPQKYFDPKKLNLFTQKELNQKMYTASYQDNILDFMDSKDGAIFNSIYTVLKSGQLNAFQSQIEGIKTMDNQTIKEAFPDIDSTPEKLRSRADSMLNRMKEMQKSYKEINDKFVNPFDGDKYKKGTKKHNEELIRSIAFEQAKMMAMFAKGTFEDSLSRANDIYNSLSSDPVLASISSSDISALTSVRGLAVELNLLKSEVAVETDPEAKKIKEKKLELLEKYNAIFTDPKNNTTTKGFPVKTQVDIINEVLGKKSVKASGFQGVFNRNKINSSGLKGAFVNYLNFLAENNDDYVINLKVDETLKKIVDFGHLKGRSQDYLKAVENLLVPENMILQAERMAVTMKATWEEHSKKNNQTVKLKKYIDKQERVEFLKALGDSENSIQPDADQTKEFLENGTMPTDYYTEDGKVTAVSDPKSFAEIEFLEKNLRSMQSGDKVETVEDDTSEFEEDDFSNIVEQASERDVLNEFIKSDTNTEKLLLDAYRRYKNDYDDTGSGTLLTKNQWVRSKKGGLGILTSRYEMSKMYEAESSTVKEEKTFEEWVDSNSRNPLLIGSNGVLTKNGVSHSDVSISKSKEEGFKSDKLSGTQKILNPATKKGVFVIETTIQENDGTKSKFYTLKDKEGNNLSDKFISLNPNQDGIRSNYSSRAEYLKAQKIIENSLPKTSTFTFAKIELTTGDIVVDSDNNQYLVRSTENMIKSNNNLYLVPVGKQNARKGSDDRVYITEDEWNQQGWKKELEQKIDLNADKITRLNPYFPIGFYPFQGSKVTEGSELDYLRDDDRDADQAAADWQEVLQKLTPTQKKNLKVLVEKNPEYDVVQAEVSEGNFRAYKINTGYGENVGLARGANEYEVTLMDGNKPLGKLVGLSSAILKDTDGSIINGAKITTEQAERLFITGKDSEKAAEQIRERYAYAQLINQEFKNALGTNLTNTFNLSQFPKINLNVKGGAIKFKDSQGNNFKTPWGELDYNTINGSVYIYDIHNVYDKNGNPVPQKTFITDIDLTTKEGIEKNSKITEEVDAAIGEYLKKDDASITDMNMGRYVAVIKLPNGSVNFVELKSDKLEIEQLNDILFGESGIKNQMEKTLTENYKDGKSIDAFFNNQYNEELENQFYISLKGGEYLSMGITQYGNLAISYNNQKTKQTDSINLTKETLESVDSVESLIKSINANWKQNQKDKSKETSDKKFKEIKLNLTQDSFLNNIPKSISRPEDLVDLVSARIAPDIRNFQARFTYTDSAAVQAATSTSDFTTPKTTTDTKTINGVTVSGTSRDVDSAINVEDVVEITPEQTEELLESEFENIPESLLKSIKYKILQGIELSPEEQLIKEGYEDEKDVPLINESLIPEEVNKEAEIKLKEEQLKNAQKDFVVNKKAELANENLSKIELNKRISQERQSNPELNALKAEIQNLRKNLGYKIVDNFDGQDVEDINTFITWASENLPSFIQVEDIRALGERLKNNGITAGAFAIELSKLTGGMDLVGKIYTGKQNPFKYHEAFHAVFRMLLSETEIKKYLRLAKQEKIAELKKEGKTLDQALSELKDLSPIYQKLSRQELENRLYEEYMSDRFDEFKMNPRSADTSSEIKSFFTRILEWIKSLFSTYSVNELNLLFNKIDTGKYKSSEIASNRFTNSDFVNTELLDNNSGVVNIAMKAIPMSEVDGLTKYFSQKDQRAMVSTIGAMYLNSVRDLVNDEDFTGEYNPDTLLSETVDKFTEIYNLEGEGASFYERDDFFDIESELIEYHSGLVNSKSLIKNAVSTYLTLFDVQVENQIEELQEEDFTAEGIVKAGDQWGEDVNQRGGAQSLSKEIRKFLATTTVRKIDRFGIEYDQPVDYVQVYNQLLKALSNTKNPKNMITKMKVYGESNENTKAAVNRIFTEIGLGQLSSEDILSGNFDINQISKPLFFQSIVKGFTQFRVDYIFAENDPKKGITNLYKANNKDDAHTQTDQWAALYGTIFEKLSKDKKFRGTSSAFLTGFAQQLNSKDSIEDTILKNKSKDFAKGLEKYLGISLSPSYIEYSIISNLENLTPSQARIKESFIDAEPIIVEDINQMISSISNHKFINGVYGSNLFLNINDSVNDNDVAEDGSSEEGVQESGDVKNRIKKIARGNAIFDERVGNTVFLDPKGNLIYAHQQPTMHLEKVAELNSEDAIDVLKDSNKFLESNYLLNDPKFIQLAREGKLRISRIIGSKMTNLESDENGNWKSNNSLDLNKKPGVSFGESTPVEFITNLINSYLIDYNAATGKTKTTEYETTDDFGNLVDRSFASTMVDIKVISESNTGDFISLPIIKAVEKTKGKVKLTDNYIDKITDEIKTEYDKVSREVNKTEGFTEKTVDNYNDFESVDEIDDLNPIKHKAAKLFKTGELLTRRSKQVVSLDRVSLKLTNTEIKAISGSTRILLKAGTFASKAGITVDVPVTIEVDGVEYTVTSRGPQNISNNNLNTIKEQLGSDISDSKSTIHKWEVKINDDVIGYTRTMDQRDFLLGKIDKNIIEIVPSSEVTVLEDSGEVSRFETDNEAKILLEGSARKGLTFDEAIKELKESQIDLKQLLNERLNQEFEEFNSLLNNLRAKTKIDKQITSELKTSEDKITDATKNSMSLFNLLANDEKHNLMQWFFNDYLNTMSINQVLLGDVSMTVKDAVDEIKRAKMQNAAGPSADSIISAPEHGVMHPVKNISAITFRDSKFQKKYSKKGGTGEKTDAQMYMTTKAFRYMMFGFGSLNAAQAKIIDKIERGEDITWEEFFGNAKENTKGFKELGAIMNSKKLVYGDGTTFIKMSAFVLTPALTSDAEGNALPNRVDLHNMRIKLERMESEGNETIGIAVPASASKMLKANVIQESNMFDESLIEEDNITNLDARWMRLQQINPSNKVENVDPGQIKQLITSEQSDGEKVFIGGTELTVGQVRELYNNTVGDRVELKYLNKRNLIFNFETTNTALQKSIDIGRVTTDLQAFLDYAVKGLESSQSKSQFLELFEVDELGSQKYDLNNPITIQKFQELFMSYFSKNVLREKQPGISAALVSDKGMPVIKKVVALDAETGQPSRWDIIRTEDWKALRNKPKINFDRFTDLEARTFSGIKIGDIYIDDLRSNVMEYDSKGNPTGQRYSEFMLPPHFAEVMQNLKPGEPIPDVIAKAFATRIPSQDKHSAVNLKLVDFLPVFYGSSGVFPEDLIEISGADFDIDKLYMQIKEFYMENGEFVEYGKSRNIDTMYDEYEEYQIKALDKKGTALNDALKVFEKRGSILEQAESLEETDIQDRDLVGALRLLSLPVTKQEFKEYVGKLNKETNTYERMPYEGAQNNQTLDYRFALLGNNGMTGPLFGRDYGINQEPAVLEPLEEVWEFIQKDLPELAEIVSEDGVIVDNALGKLKAWTNNKAGARSIGAVVLPNIVLNLLKENKVKVINENKDGVPVSKIYINGHNYDNFGINYEIDPKTGKQIKNGTRTQFVISALVTAMTDNAKERLAAKLGLNKNALAIVTNLVALGVKIKTAILLINNPEIRDLYYKAINKDDPMDPGIGSLVNSTLELYKESDSVLYSEAQKTGVTDEKMINLIEKNEINVEDKNDKRDQIATLMLFKQAHDLTKTTSKVQSLVTLISGLGRDTESIDARQSEIKQLGVELTNEEFGKTNVPIDVRKIFKGKSFQARYYKIFKNFVELTPAVFVTRTEPFVKLTNLVIDNLDGFRIDSKNKNKIEKDILSYLTGKAYKKLLIDNNQSNLAVSLNNGLIYDQFAEQSIPINDIIVRVREVLKSKGKSNFFVQSQLFNKTTTNGTNKSGVNQVQMNTWSRLSDEALVDMQNSMVELYQDIATREDAIHLIHYLLVKDGLQYAPNTFLAAIPVPMLDSILASSAKVHNLFKDNLSTDQNYENVFGDGVTFDSLAEEMVEGYLSSRSNAYYLNQVFKNKRNIANRLQVIGEDTETTSEVDYYEGNITPEPNTVFVFGSNPEGRHGAGAAKIARNQFGAIYGQGEGLQGNAYALPTKDLRVKENKSFKSISPKQITESIKSLYNVATQNLNKQFKVAYRNTTQTSLNGYTGLEIIDMFNDAGTIPSNVVFSKEWFNTGKLNIKPIQTTEVKEGKSTAQAKVALYNKKDETLTFDLFAGSKFDLKKYKGRKGSFKRRLDSNNKIASNAKFLETSGIKKVERRYKGATISLGRFPMVISFYSDKEYKFFKLEQLFSPLTETDRDGLFNLDQTQNVGLGNRAMYKEIKMLGSMQQNSMGFVYGPRTEYDILQEAIQAQQPLIGMDKIAEDAAEAAAASAEAIAEGGFLKKDEIITSANQDGITSVEKKKSVSLKELGITSAKNLHLGEGDVTYSQDELKKAMEDDNGTDEGDYKKLIDFYNDLTKIQKSKIANPFSENGLEISNVEDLIEDFLNENNLNSEEDYIDQLKKCYK